MIGITTTWETVLNSHSIRKVEDHWVRTGCSGDSVRGHSPTVSERVGSLVLHLPSHQTPSCWTPFLTYLILFHG